MKSLLWTGIFLASVSFSISSEAGKFKILDGQWCWDYDHSTQTAKLYADGKAQEIGTVSDMKVHGRWDEKNGQLWIILNSQAKGPTNARVKPLACTLEKDGQGVQRFKVTEKEPEQGEWERYISLGSSNKMEEIQGLMHEGQDYSVLLDDYFEKKITQSETTGETGFLCTSAVGYRALGNKLHWNHTIVDGASYDYVELVHRKPTLTSAATETKKVLGRYVAIAPDSPERVKLEPASPTGCPSHPTKGHLGSYNNPGCLKKHESQEEFFARLKAEKNQ